MDLSFELILVFLALGAGIGFLAGLFGIGGGAYIVPILTIILSHNEVPVEYALKISLGTAMACIVFTTFSSMRAQQKRGGILWNVVKAMTPGVVIGVFISTYIAAKIDSFYLGLIFTIFMAYVAYTMFTNKKPKPSRTILPNKYLFASGGFIGIISGLVSIAGGSLTVPFLVWQNIDMKKAIGTSSGVGFFLTIVGAFGYIINGMGSHIDLNLQYSLGYVYLPAVLFISLTSFFFAPLGVKLVYKLPIPIIKKIFGCLTLFLSLRMLYTILQG